MSDDKEIQYEFEPVTIDIKGIIIDELKNAYDNIESFANDNEDDEEHNIARSLNTMRIVLRLLGKDVRKE